MRSAPAFTDIKVNQEMTSGRSREWNFAISFNYVAAKAAVGSRHPKRIDREINVVLSKREKYIGYGAGAAVLLLGLNSFVIS